MQLLQLSIKVFIFIKLYSLPPGQVHIADDVTAPYPCEDEKSSDFDDFFEENSSDFIGSLTKCSLDNNAHLNTSDIETTELIQSYKMEGFQSQVKVCVDIHRPLIYPSVGGKVLKNGQWISANVIRVKVITGKRSFKGI